MYYQLLSLYLLGASVASEVLVLILFLLPKTLKQRYSGMEMRFCCYQSVPVPLIAFTACWCQYQNVARVTTCCTACHSTNSWLQNNQRSGFVLVCLVTWESTRKRFFMKHGFVVLLKDFMNIHFFQKPRCARPLHCCPVVVTAKLWCALIWPKGHTTKTDWS